MTTNIFYLKLQDSHFHKLFHDVLSNLFLFAKKIDSQHQKDEERTKSCPAGIEPLGIDWTISVIMSSETEKYINNCSFSEIAIWQVCIT